MKKEKYLQIFNYLLEFSRLRSNPVRDIENSTNYTEILWMSDVPRDDRIDCILHDEYSNESDYWLKISKPVEPKEPEEPVLPSELIKWIVPNSWDDEDGLLKLRNSIEDSEGLIHELLDHPEIQTKFEDFCNSEWTKEALRYRQDKEEYNAAYNLYRTVSETYTKLFSIHNKTQQFGEEFEFVCGIGLMYFKENDDSPKVNRHLITARAEVQFEYSPKESYLIVTANTQNELQIETDAIIDLYEQFDSNDILESEKKAKELIKQKELVNPFDNGIHDILQLIADRIKPTDVEYHKKEEREKELTQKVRISYSPALILRKRDTRSFTATYERIIEDIESEDNPSIPTIDDIVDLDEANPITIESKNGANNITHETILFPKEYNEEQLSIVSKARLNNKVLVQGPPGTGKSHTIANLICHLLANGKKVLVTAYTKRALEVLKDKLPPQFQKLTVNLLSGDSSSIQDLEASVNSINDELANTNIDRRKDLIIKNEKKLEELEEKRAYETNELLKIKEASTRNIEINSSYKGTLTELAHKLENEGQDYEWYKDDFSDINDNEMIPNLERFLKLSKEYKTKEAQYNDLRLPVYSKLLKTKDLEDYNKIESQKIDSGKNDHSHLHCSDFNTLNSLLLDIHDVFKKIDRIQHPFKSDIIKDATNYNDREWKAKIEKTTSLLANLENHNLRRIDRNVEIKYPSNRSLINIKNDAKVLLKFLESGNSLSGYNFKIKKAFFPKDIKEKLYFIDSVIINGSPCDTIEEFGTVLDDIQITQDFNELRDLWSPSDVSTSSRMAKFEYFRQLNNDSQNILLLINNAKQLISQTQEISNVRFKEYTTSEIIRITSSVNLAEISSRKDELEAKKKQVLEYFFNTGLKRYQQIEHFDTTLLCC